MLDFSAVKKQEYDNSNFKRVDFMRFTPGNHIVRVIEDKVSAIDTHFVLGKYLVKCLGEACPICRNNRKIIQENPEDFREVKGYYNRSTRYFMNVVDRTPAITCPECATENKSENGTSFPSACSNCDAILTGVDPKPLSKVKLLSCGITLCNQLKSLQIGIQDSNHEPVGLANFDINFVITGRGKTKSTMPMPYRMDKIGPIDYDKEELADHTKGVITLQSEELIELLKGVALRDIYTARRTEVAVEEEDNNVVAFDIEKTVQDIFSD